MPWRKVPIRTNIHATRLPIHPGKTRNALPGRIPQLKLQSRGLDDQFHDYRDHKVHGGAVVPAVVLGFLVDGGGVDFEFADELCTRVDHASGQLVCGELRHDDLRGEWFGEVFWVDFSGEGAGYAGAGDEVALPFH
jgi:hypothetical protein